MTPSQPKSGSPNDLLSKSIELWKRTLAFGEKALKFGDKVIEVIKANPIPTLTIASTILIPSVYTVGPDLYTAVESQIDKLIQSVEAKQPQEMSTFGSQVTAQHSDTHQPSINQPETNQPEINQPEINQRTVPDTNQQAVLSYYLDRMQDLLDRENITTTGDGITENSRGLLKATAFTALRNLDLKHKGYFIRFLHEYGLIKKNLPGLSLSGADLREINLQDAWLPDINLQGTYLLSANLIHTNLKRANLSGADLTGTDLTGANLSGVNLTDTNFTGANLAGADLDVEQAIQSGAIFCRATMPDGEPSHQPCP